MHETIKTPPALQPDVAAWQQAVVEGRVLERIALDEIRTDDLPRDRLDLDAVRAAPEMTELRVSIRTHGQKEPIEVYHSPTGLQLKKGWRRLAALKALYAEAGEDRFATALVRIDTAAIDGVNGRLRHYVDMVEENVLRQDLSYAEMASIAIEAAADSRCGEVDAAEMVNQLFGALTKMKRSHIRSFVGMLTALGSDLKFAPDVPRDLGLTVARAIKDRPNIVAPLRRALADCQNSAAQNRVLREHTRKPKVRRVDGGEVELPEIATSLVAEPGLLLIDAPLDFAAIDRELLQRAAQTLCQTIGRSQIPSD